jgi:hypothetical protein
MDLSTALSTDRKVGPDPGGEKWKSEFFQVVKALWVLQGILPSQDYNGFKYKILVSKPWARSWEGYVASHQQVLQEQVANGWTLENAAIISLCYNYNAVLSRSVRQKSSLFAGLNHKVYRLLANKAAEMDRAGKLAPLGYKHLVGGIPGLVAQNLVYGDPGWEHITKGGGKDAATKGSGFRGINATGITKVDAGKCKLMSPQGIRAFDFHRTKKYHVMDSPVVRFVSKLSDDAGLHSGIQLDAGERGDIVFPPMTLFKVVDEAAAGDWDFDGTVEFMAECRRIWGSTPPPTQDRKGRLQVTREDFNIWLALNHPNCQQEHLRGKPWGGRSEAWVDENFLPDGAKSTIYPVQRPLIVVEATFLVPPKTTLGHDDGDSAGDGAAAADDTATGDGDDTSDGKSGYGYSDQCSKLVDAAWQLSFADRTAYIRGTDEITVCPVLTMEQEWAQGRTWTDWSGRVFIDKDEWDYVVEGVPTEADTPVGRHEQGRNCRGRWEGTEWEHVGWTLDAFVFHINSIVTAHYVEHNGRQPIQVELLTRDEVISLRLYTGTVVI